MKTNTTRVLLAGTFLALVCTAGCRPPNDHSERNGSRQSSSRKSDKAESKKTTPVSAEVPTPPKPQPTPVIESNVVKPNPHTIRERVCSAYPHPTIAEAEEDAYQQARLRITERLAEWNPPIRHTPSLSMVREQYVRADTRVVRMPNESEASAIERAGLTGKQMYVEYTVEVSESQLRDLRKLDRVVDALRVIGGLFVVFAAGFLFLRADEWTRGYLTSWLGLLAVLGVIAGLVAVLAMGTST